MLRVNAKDPLFSGQKFRKIDMCKITDIKTGIKKLDFAARRGKMTVYLTDGREVIVPLSFFPEIKKLSLKERNNWIILDDQFFTFTTLSKIFSIKDIMTL